MFSHCQNNIAFQIMLLMHIQPIQELHQTPTVNIKVSRSKQPQIPQKSMLADHDLQAENINKFIQPGLAIADKYHDKMGDTDVYIIAMCESTSLFF
jgi:hypothetical protein